MTRQITITVAGVQYMVNVDIESGQTDIVYHVNTPQHFRKELPETFDIVKRGNEQQPRYDIQHLEGTGREVAEAVWQQLCTLPPQFKGARGKEETDL
ncbi:hypothetical protein [uncultured Chitinophaga sp.]|jgi:hypothetical protein|uniref:hypothetical protein n=1 Tax=uncultured Chitinophaga sp. TaxID=339340 RepID=UPI0026166554|nr:hypothetical protein [uncultured Chitinophaga sp.]